VPSMTYCLVTQQKNSSDALQKAVRASFDQLESKVVHKST